MPLWVKRLHYAFLRLRIGIQGRLPHPRLAKGDRFRATRPIRARGLIQWKAPFTSGFECTIPEGTILVPEWDSVRISTGFACVPINRDELEQQLFPEEDRKSEKYAGYYFYLPYKHIGTELESCQ